MAHSAVCELSFCSLVCKGYNALSDQRAQYASTCFTALTGADLKGTDFKHTTFCELFL